jgi:hypothetical protein
MVLASKPENPEMPFATEVDKSSKELNRVVFIYQRRSPHARSASRSASFAAETLPRSPIESSLFSLAPAGFSSYLFEPKPSKDEPTANATKAREAVPIGSEVGS